MHAILLTLGTDGDLFPYVGLGANLRARGHRVTLASSESYRALAHEHDLAFRPLMSRGEADEFLAHPDLWHPYKGALLGASWAVRHLERHFDIITDLAREPDAVLIANPAMLAGRIVHDKLGVPIASLILQPWLIPSIFEPPLLPGITLPRWAPSWAGHLYWRTVDATGDFLVGRAVNRYRASLGLTPIRRVFRWWLSPALVIGMFPPWYGPPQPDWPAQVRLAGFPMFDGRADNALPADVLEFCGAGPPPIAFTLGTGMMHAAEFFRAAVDACRLLGRRGLLLTKFAHLLPATLPVSVRHCAYAPFRALFPRCAAIVHHGGIGTTARALASGAPQLVVPLSFDQPDNALRVRRLGAGASLGPRHRNGDHLAHALAKLLGAGTKDACQAVAARFGAPDPLDVAAGWVEGLAASAGAQRTLAGAGITGTAAMQPSHDFVRLVPERAFPPYAYVPGRSPHPVSDAAGHSFGARPGVPDSLGAETWQANKTYLFAIDLFNGGYYWESHVEFESLWLGSGRKGVLADFLKGWIKLAAAGVKQGAAVPAGVTSHATRAAQLWRTAATALGPESGAFLGFQLSELIGMADRIARSGWPPSPPRFTPLAA